MQELTEKEATNREVVRRMFEVFSTGDLAVIDEIVDPNLLSHNPHPGTTNNREGLKQQISFLRATFPDARFTEEDVVVEDDKVFLRWSMEATDRGGYMGRAPTGQSIKHQGQEFLRLKDGRIVEHHGEESNLEFLDKLGARSEDGSPGVSARPH
ncbi:MAG TPA: ester cyclase [Gemmatimonadaceae bacterium]|jgi:predicted ester cyclase|nr:ester cyclase [Gemmatimonadaceae bacterium]